MSTVTFTTRHGKVSAQMQPDCSNCGMASLHFLSAPADLPWYQLTSDIKREMYDDILEKLFTSNISLNGNYKVIFSLSLTGKAAVLLVLVDLSSVFWKLRQKRDIRALFLSTPLIITVAIL